MAPKALKRAAQGPVKLEGRSKLCKGHKMCMHSNTSHISKSTNTAQDGQRRGQMVPRRSPNGTWRGQVVDLVALRFQFRPRNVAAALAKSPLVSKESWRQDLGAPM